MSASTTDGKVPPRCSRLRRALDLALIGEFAQHVLELRPIGVLGAEGARDFARADLASMLADEGEKLLSREGRWDCFMGRLVRPCPGQGPFM